MWETILDYWWVALILLIAPPIIRSINAPRMPRPPKTQISNTTVRGSANISDDDIRKIAMTNEIEAIKLYRQKTGVGLEEAKEMVELMMLEELDKKNPS